MQNRDKNLISNKEWDALLDSIPLQKIPPYTIDVSVKEIDEEWSEFGFNDREIDDTAIEEQNNNLLRRQKIFRLAAGFIADEYTSRYKIKF